MQWLQEQGWPIDARQKVWRQSNRAEDRAPLIPVTNSVCRRLPLWLGSLPDEERQRREAQGQRVVPLESLRPWGKAVTLFARERPEDVLALLETGATAESLRWWQNTYPQLIWEQEGPLAPK